MRHRTVLIFFMALVSSWNLLANPNGCKKLDISSSETKVHLVELYTSEGCSSCPPAEKWINSLRSHKELGVRFFPVAFHVDYWDYIGWKDPYAKKIFSLRQRSYANIWNSRNVYTPGLVLNGKEWRGWRGESIPGKSKQKVGVLKSKCLGDRKYEVSFSGNFKRLKLNYALLGNGIVSKVKAGENAGKTLEQYFVVLEHRRVSFDQGKKVITMPDSTLKTTDRMVVFWLDDEKTMEPVQVVAGKI